MLLSVFLTLLSSCQHLIKSINATVNPAREPQNKDKDKEQNKDKETEKDQEKDSKERLEREMESLDEGVRAICTQMDSDPRCQNELCSLLYLLLRVFVGFFWLGNLS